MKMSTKDKILSAADRLFAEKGFDGVSIRDIINEAGVNLGAVTYYFGTKEQLFSSMLMRKMEPMKKMGLAIVSSRKSPLEKLRGLMDVYTTHLLCTDPSLKVYFAEILAGGRRLPKEVKEAMSLRNHLFIQVVKEGVKAGIFRKCDLECAAWNFFGMVAPYILYEPIATAESRHAPYPKSYVERIVAASLDMYLNGLLAKKAKSK